MLFVTDGNDETIEEQFVRCFCEGFMRTDQLLYDSPVVHKSFCFPRRLDFNDGTGSTVSTVAVLPDYLVFACAGDSRSILVSNGAIAYETTDHQPSNPNEQERIRRSSIAYVNRRRLCKVRGGLLSFNLGVSRGLGDFSFKKDKTVSGEEQPFTCYPDVEVIERREGDEYIVIASDGLWGWMSSNDVLKFVNYKLFRQGRSTEQCVAELLQFCYDKRQSSDNISIIIIKLC